MLRSSDPQLTQTFNEMVTVVVDPQRIATIWLDMPGRTVNTLTPTMCAALGDAVALAQREQVVGVIVSSRKRNSFIAGADLFEISKMDAFRLNEFLAAGQAVLEKLAGLSMPTVAAINGDCLGGGLEVALACRSRVAAADRKIQIGMPEVKLGLVPGWGGTVRLPRTIGLKKALPLLLTGKAVSPGEAQRLKLVDELAAPQSLLDVARRIISAGADRHGEPIREDAAILLERAAQDIRTQTHGNYPAPVKLIQVMHEGLNDPEAGMKAERKALVELAATDESRNMMRLFFLRQAARKNAYAKASGGDAKLADRQIAHAAVIGGGTMGAGIAYSLARVGIAVDVIEVDEPAVARARNGLQNLWNSEAAAGRLSSEELRELIGCVSAGTNWPRLASAQLVIEAVPEEMELKRQIFSRIAQTASKDAITATNTSSLDIDDLASLMPNPSRVVGLHFFNPVPRMPLVEIVRGRSTSAEALVAAIRLSERLAKTPIIANNRPGFIVNRVLIPYLTEAMLLADDGVPIESIDSAMTEWGWPMGPFELTDEIGLDVTLAIMSAMAVHFPQRLPIPDFLVNAISHGWKGKKSGIGFYHHHPHGAPVTGGRKMINSDVTSIAANTSRGPMLQESIQWRLMLPMINQAAAVLEDGVTDSPDDIDLATTLGLGFPPFRGGLVKLADTTGAGEIVIKLQRLTREIGPRFAPAQLLRRVAEAGLNLAEYHQLPEPAGNGNSEDVPAGAQHPG